MNASPAPEPTTVDASDLQAHVRRVWGHDDLLPLQEEAVKAGVAGRDSLVVLPTGGGKSLCYQLPPLILGCTDVVVSPLIALMKDQVDGLVGNGYPAAALHSLMTPAEQARVEARLLAGELRLVFVAPERLLGGGFLDLAARLPVRAFAIDEAHCISQWGHDFRPEYRQLATLRQRFPHASLHAFTATATEAVREDIVLQLGLRDPLLLVGRFDRPNLTYRIRPRVDLAAQVLEAIQAQPGQAAIVYCLSRGDTESLAGHLQAAGVRAAAYHAGLDGAVRHRVQEAFLAEDLDVVVATVAFGMGIDRSDVRLVVHATLPKSIEHFQQETGRAGRDGLPANCLLIYSGSDVIRWEHLLRRSILEKGRELEGDGLRDGYGGQEDPAKAQLRAQVEALHVVQRFCVGVTCRHEALSAHFGQDYDGVPCGACDVCLGELALVEDGTELARKVLSAVARTGGRFGVGHVSAVLAGAQTESIGRWGHDKLSVFGLLAHLNQKQIAQLVFQLIGQGLLAQTEGSRPVVVLNDASLAVLRGEREVSLLREAERRASRSRADVASWEGVDLGLYDELRRSRSELARRQGVPAYIILADASLRELARRRPSSLAGLREVHGIGERKLADLGEWLLEAIDAFCDSAGLTRDVQPPRQAAPPPRRAERSGLRRSNPLRDAAMAAFAEGRDVAEIASTTGRAPSTIWGYLEEYVAERRPDSLAPWVEDDLRARIEAAAAATPAQGLGALHAALEGEADYAVIRTVLAWRRALREQRAPG